MARDWGEGAGTAVISARLRQPIGNTKQQKPITKKTPNLKPQDDHGRRLMSEAIGENVGIDLVAVFDFVAPATAASLDAGRVIEPFGAVDQYDPTDRKSTRLNSSHGYISYA